MVQATLRYLLIPDLRDPEHDQPQDAQIFEILVQAIIGPLEERGEESFQFVVVSPKWIEQRLQKDGFLFGKDYLVLPKYDYNRIFDLISRLCQRASGADWHEVAISLSRFGQWEFEDYKQ